MIMLIKISKTSTLNKQKIHKKNIKYPLKNQIIYLKMTNMKNQNKRKLKSSG